MFPAQRIALTAGFTCQLFAIRRAAGVHTLPSVFKHHGSAAAATLAITDSPLVRLVSAMAVASATVLLLAFRGIGLKVEQTKLLLSNPNSSACLPPSSTLPLTPLKQLMMIPHFGASPQEVAEAARDKESQLSRTPESPARCMRFRHQWHDCQDARHEQVAAEDLTTRVPSDPPASYRGGIAGSSDARKDWQPPQRRSLSVSSHAGSSGLPS